MQLCLVWSGTADQVNPYTVRGEVRDSAQKLAALHVGVAGIYGVVGAMHGYRPMAGATVQVGGANRSAVTDSAGRFFVPIQRPGVYMVRMTQPGYEDHVFPIDIPRDRPVEASRFLDSTDKLPRLGPDGSRQDFDRRLLWRSVNSAPALGSELGRRGGTLAESLPCAMC